jgi:alpha-galactosidase
MVERANCVIALRSEGVSLVLDVTDGQLPAIVHWGADLGTLEVGDAEALVRSNIDPGGANIVDEPVRLAILPEHWTGWVGRPGLSGSRAGRAWSPKFTTTEVRLDGETVIVTEDHPALINSGLASVEVDAVDEVAQLSLSITVELTAGGLIRARTDVVNTGEDPYAVNDCVIAFPIPQDAREILDFAGHWGKERVPQRLPSVYICGRAARAALVRMRPPCCTSECRVFPSPTGRSGRYTPLGAETTRTMRSGSSPVGKCSAAGNSCSPER